MSFLPAWKDTRPRARVLYDESKKVAFCTICRLARSKSIWTNDGYSGGKRGIFLLSQITEHSASKGHIDATNVIAQSSALQLGFARSADAEQRKMQTAIATATVSASYKEWHPHALRLAYFLAKFRLPYELMPELAQVVRGSIELYVSETAFGRAAGAYATYTTNTSAGEMVAVCRTSVLAATLAAVRLAKYFSVMVDESTDIASSKNLIMMLRFVHGATVATRMLALVELADGTAKTIVDVILATLEKHDLDIANLVGFASDGASVMIGRIKGVATWLEKLAPRVVASHCCAHRLSLATEDAEGPLDEAAIACIMTVYKYLSKSEPRRKQLAEAGTRTLKPLQGAVTRWLSRGHILANAFENFPALCIVLKKDTNTVVAQTLFKDFFSNAGFYFWVACMADILAIVNILSKALQSESLHVTSVPSVVEASVKQLHDAFLSGNGVKAVTTPSVRLWRHRVGNYEEIEQEPSVVDAYLQCVSYVGRFICEIKTRFPPEADFLRTALTDVTICNTYPTIVELLKIAATLSPGSVDCERAFSLQNNIKTKYRTGLSADHLNDLMICARDGPSVGGLDVSANMELEHQEA
ncbi:hypothetical protein ACHHYP_11820 [Achlya hypogyna]|uniref:Uncharacterized protein n=1 Tax=Achlya hypogyna TaxID=1202772 RepID=A0A1V9YIA3_ACHHY|nr:hypothetical protein ACHHYP_11820 [Achlya hypogyna]